MLSFLGACIGILLNYLVYSSLAQLHNHTEDQDDQLDTLSQKVEDLSYRLQQLETNRDSKSPRLLSRRQEG